MAVKEPVKLPDFDLQGHRGARGLMPENTVPAMLRALELGITTLEMDVHISQDEKVVVSHDPFINPAFSLTPGGKEIPDAGKSMYKLYVMDYAEIRMFDVGSKHYPAFPRQEKMEAHIPLLAEVIEAVQAKTEEDSLEQVFYNIEIKSAPETDERYHPVPAKFVQLVMEVVEEQDIRDWVIIQSFDPRVLNIVHQLYPQQKTSLLVENEEGLETNLAKLDFIPSIYSPDYSLLNRELIRAVHERGMKIIPWTVNEQEKTLGLKQMGVDGIISDYPDRLISLRESKTASDAADW